MRTHPRPLQRGMALISSLLLLLVITILGIGMFRSFGMQERIAGNTREKEKALHAANTAETYAEWWLTANSGANATTGTPCGALVNVSATVAGGQVCSNSISTIATNGVGVVPWIGSTGSGSSSEIAVAYTPPNFTLETSTGVLNSYYEAPRFYISFLSTSNPRPSITTNIYQIDAVGYGSNPNSVAVVESGYVVSQIRTSQSGLKQFENLGGP
jgi:type IV pilus assembly protein PilX